MAVTAVRAAGNLQILKQELSTSSRPPAKRVSIQPNLRAGMACLSAGLSKKPTFLGSSPSCTASFNSPSAVRTTSALASSPGPLAGEMFGILIVVPLEIVGFSGEAA